MNFMAPALNAGGVILASIGYRLSAMPPPAASPVADNDRSMSIVGVLLAIPARRWSMYRACISKEKKIIGVVSSWLAIMLRAHQVLPTLVRARNRNTSPGAMPPFVLESKRG